MPIYTKPPALTPKEIRLQSLTLAQRATPAHLDKSAAELVDAAKKFEAFIIGEKPKPKKR